LNRGMTPRQIELVTTTLESLDLDTLAIRFYEQAFASDPSLAAMFTSDPAIQRARFGMELAALMTSIRELDDFCESTMALGARHRTYGVHPAHYRLMGHALLSSLSEALGEGWTPEVEEAWALAYNLTAEMMMTGAMNPRRSS
jgi:hemoglobin-like flavoprotein